LATHCGGLNAERLIEDGYMMPGRDEETHELIKFDTDI